MEDDGITIHVIDTMDMRWREFRLSARHSILGAFTSKNVERALEGDLRVKDYDVHLRWVRVQLHDGNLWVCNSIVESDIRRLLTSNTTVRAA